MNYNPTTITEFRILIHCFLNSIKYLNASREVSLANTYLQRTSGWLGKALEAAGSVSPYTQSQNPDSTTIESKADQSDENIFPESDVLKATQTARVKHFRGTLQDAIDKFKSWRANSEGAGPEYEKCLDEAFTSLTDVKMWFGWELGRIKKIQDGAAPIGEKMPELPL